jgi:hypothetical protein
MRLAPSVAVLLAAGLAFAAAGRSEAQQPAASYQLHRDLIRGRVTTDSGAAIVAAEVAVTMAPDRNTQFAKTDSSGRYEVVFERGTGDYLVHVAAPAKVAFRKRVTRTGSDSVFTVDAVLKPLVQQLAAVRVQARRQRPARETGGFGQPSPGSAEQMPNGVGALIPPDQAGNLDAVASSMPGISAVPGGGVSVLGLPPSQNQTTLNGLAFGGGSVPRGASTTTRIATSAYDPARGGFSGAETRVTLSPGNITTFRRAFLTLDAPQLQSADAVARRSGATYGAVDANVGTEGATKLERWMYNTGLEYKRQVSDATSLTDADVDVLAHAGVAHDSVARLLAALNALGIPSGGAGIPTSRVTDYVSFIGRVDRPLFDYSTFTPLNTTWGVTGYANYTRRGALAFGPTSTAAHGGESTQLAAGGQYAYSAYFGKLKDELTELRTGVSVSRSRNSPYVDLPDGRVLVSSDLGQASGIASLGFAGNSAFESSRTNFTWETTSETQFYWKGRAAHRGKLYGETRLDHFSQDPGGNRLGTFSFNSLADLAANQPASFTRTLFTPSRAGGEWSGALAASDQWAATQHFTLLYGARLEGNAFTSGPALNTAVEQLFGARTDHAPNTWHVSPRVGFNWLSTTRARPAYTGMTVSSLGSFYSMARGVLRGGFGEFRQLLDPSLLSDATAATGLPSGVRRITCLGSAVPTPDWAAYETSESAIPSECIGVPSSGFADAAPAVQLFDRRYQPARAWRGNLSWGSAIKDVSYTIDAAYSLNVDQPSTVDLNFDRTPRFTLPAEGGRPVYVPVGGIVPSTGAVSAVSARRSTAFGPVLERTSDLRGWARQLSVRARPTAYAIKGKWVIDGTYTFTQTRAQARGFDGAASGDPAAISWARSDYTPTHEFVLQAGYQNGWFAMSLAGKASSGLPYTPIVGSDVNGDGLANDRAFVFARGGGADPATVSALDALIASTSGNARRCLERQRGSTAARNSCEGPWSATLNASISPSFALTRSLRKYHVQGLSLYLTNPLGGLDQLLHGGNLHGWGSPAVPDRVLYYARGFDSTTRQFRYEVNPRFGNTRPSATSFRVPFRVTLDVRMDFSRDGEQQQLDRLLTPGRNGNGRAKLDSAAIVRRYCGNLPNFYDNVLSQSDSLLLTRDQVDALRAASSNWAARIAAHWGQWAAELASLPDHYDVSDLAKRQTKLIDDAWEMARQEARATFPKILSPVQLKLLPGWAATFYQADKPMVGWRYFSTSQC